MLSQDMLQEEGSALAHSCSLAGIPCYWCLCCWSQREEAEMKVRIGKERVTCKIVNLSILITTMVIIRDIAKTKYATCLRGLNIQCSQIAIWQLINHNNVEIHTQNGCLGLDWLLFHYSDMERAKRNLRVKEVVKWRTYFSIRMKESRLANLHYNWCWRWVISPSWRDFFSCTYILECLPFSFAQEWALLSHQAFCGCQNKSTSSGMMMEHFFRVSRTRLQIWLTKWTAFSAVGALVHSAESPHLNTSLLFGVCWQILVQREEILHLKEKNAEVAINDNFSLLWNADVSACVLVLPAWDRELR